MKLPEKKLDVKLVALDLDDTLLGSDLKISDRNVDILRQCAESGIYVVPCSGRMEDAILPFVRRLAIAGMETGRFIIAINGCSIFDLHKRQQIYCNKVPAEILLRADELAEQAGLRSEVYTPDVIYYREETKWTRLDVDLCKGKGEVVADYDNFLKKGFTKMLIPGEPEQLQELQKVYKKEFGNKAVVFTSKPYFLEVLPPNCGKGEAITWLANYLGFDASYAMGFGDAMNDESMIRLCGYGVAMKNGIDYIKDIADFVTEKTNDESGIGDFLEKYVL